MAKSRTQDISASGPVIRPGEMTVGKIEVSQDLSAERAAGQPARPPLEVALLPHIGDTALLQIAEGIWRPLLISMVYKGGIVSGTVFFAPEDNTPWMQAKLRQRVAEHDCTRWVRSVSPGLGVGEWRPR